MAILIFVSIGLICISIAAYLFTVELGRSSPFIWLNLDDAKKIIKEIDPGEFQSPSDPESKEILRENNEVFRENSKTFDKEVIWLSGSAIAIIAAFLSGHSGSPILELKELSPSIIRLFLYAKLTGFVLILSIVSTISSFVFAIEGQDKERKMVMTLQNELQKIVKVYNENRKNEANKRFRMIKFKFALTFLYRHLTLSCTLFSYFSFIIGMIFLILAFNNF